MCLQYNCAWEAFAEIGEQRRASTDFESREVQCARCFVFCGAGCAVCCLASGDSACMCSLYHMTEVRVLSGGAVPTETRCRSTRVAQPAGNDSYVCFVCCVCMLCAVSTVYCSCVCVYCVLWMLCAAHMPWMLRCEATHYEGRSP